MRREVIGRDRGAQILAAGLGLLAVALLASKLLTALPEPPRRPPIANASNLGGGNFPIRPEFSGIGPRSTGAPEIVEQPAPVVAPEPASAPPAAKPSPALPDAEKKPPEPDRTAITGRLITPRGRDVPAAFQIDVVSEDGGSPVGGAAPQRDGTFQSGPLPPGTYTLKARTAYGLLCGTAVGITSGTRDLRLSIHSPGEIAGRVLDSEGNPAKAGILVIAETAGYAGEYFSHPWYEGKGRRSTAWTQEDGTFVIEYLGEFEFSVRISGGDGAPRHAPFPEGTAVEGVRLGQRNVTLTLEKPSPKSPGTGRRR